MVCRSWRCMDDLCFFWDILKYRQPTWLRVVKHWIWLLREVVPSLETVQDQLGQGSKHLIYLKVFLGFLVPKRCHCTRAGAAERSITLLLTPPLLISRALAGWIRVGTGMPDCIGSCNVGLCFPSVVGMELSVVKALGWGISQATAASFIKGYLTRARSITPSVMLCWFLRFGGQGEMFALHFLPSYSYSVSVVWPEAYLAHWISSLPSFWKMFLGDNSTPGESNSILYK